MNRTTILLLEDDADRVQGFELAVAQLGPQYRLRVWRDAHRMSTPDLNDLQFFAIVVEHGGYAAAERALALALRHDRA